MAKGTEVTRQLPGTFKFAFKFLAEWTFHSVFRDVTSATVTASIHELPEPWGLSPKSKGIYLRGLTAVNATDHAQIHSSNLEYILVLLIHSDQTLV
jgi:hypothetical protein